MNRKFIKKRFVYLLPGDFIATEDDRGSCHDDSRVYQKEYFWDYKENGIADSLLDYYGIDEILLAPRFPVLVSRENYRQLRQKLLGISEGTPVCYRAGDQPNNAFSLQVMDPGEIAATAGTSGVLYG